jgi:hypothetical protein
MPSGSAVNSDRLGLTVSDHPKNNSDLAPSDLHLFWKLNERLREYHTSCQTMKSRPVKICCRQQDAQFCRDGLMNVPERW